MKKIICNFGDFNPEYKNAVSAPVTEEDADQISGDKETKNYMLFANLDNICRMVQDIQDMDKDFIDGLISDGHDWAPDHIAKAKESISHVYNWLNSTRGHGGNKTEASNTPADVTIDGIVPVEETKNKLTDSASDYISGKISKLKGEGYPDNQAAAIAYSMAKKRGFKVGENPNESIEENSEHRAKKLERPLDAPYFTDMLHSYALNYMDDDPEVAMELKQVARMLKSSHPNHRDISLYDVLNVVEEVGIEDKSVEDKVKSEIEEAWAGA
jgi:hypothetical protein